MGVGGRGRAAGVELEVEMADEDPPDIVQFFKEKEIKEKLCAGSRSGGETVGAVPRW